MDILVENVMVFLETEPYVMILGTGPIFGAQPVLVEEKLFYTDYLPKFYQFLTKANEYRNRAATGQLGVQTDLAGRVTTTVPSINQAIIELNQFVSQSFVNVWNNPLFCASDLTMDGRKVKINHIYHEKTLHRVLNHLVTDMTEVQKIKDLDVFIGTKAPYIGSCYHEWLSQHF